VKEKNVGNIRNGKLFDFDDVGGAAHRVERS
jgi:hypothetical protein